MRNRFDGEWQVRRVEDRRQEGGREETGGGETTSHNNVQHKVNSSL